jgi:CRISPR system Cascade subunit CasA
VTGYAMSHKKVLAFTESEIPLPGTDPAAAQALAIVANRLVDAAVIAASALRGAVRDARGMPAKPDRAGKAELAAVEGGLWAATNDPFFALLPGTAARDWEAALEAVAAPWRAIPRATTLRLSDEGAPLDPTVPSCNPARIVQARRTLLGALEGWGPDGRRLFEALRIPSREPKAKRKTK